MNRWEAFIAVCGHLRAGLLGGEQPSERRTIAWELLIEASSHHGVTPALAWCLRDQPGVPSEIRDYLEAILALNGRRNEHLLAGLARAIGALNSIDIEPVLLKGAARLVEASYPSPMLRFLGDLDVLIPAERSADAAAALQSIGFRVKADDEILPSSHHHLRMLHDPETGAGVELHTALLSGAGAPLLPYDWFCQGSTPLPFKNLQIRVPDATRSVGHIIAHDQFVHDGYCLRRVELRQLLDLSMIREKHERAIDWMELDDRFCRMGFGKVLATYVEFAKRLLGQLAPLLKHAPRVGAMSDLRHVIEPSRWQPWRPLAKHLIEYLAERRRDPRGVLKLLDVAAWPTRIGRIKKEFKRNPPSW